MLFSLLKFILDLCDFFFFFQFSCWLLLLWILLNCSSLGNILLPVLSFFLGKSNSHQFAASTIVMTQISSPIPLLWALNLLDISKLYHLKCLTILFYLPFTFIPVNRLHLSNLKPDNPASSLSVNSHIQLISKFYWCCFQIT